MIFSNLARLLAVVAFVLGLVSVLVGTGAAMGLLDEPTQARYVVGSPGRMIDRGIYAIFVAVALGTLAEISFSVRR